MEKYLVDYLNHVGVDDVNDYTAHYEPCEVCGSEKFSTIRENISIGRGKFGKLPVQACKQCGFLMQNPRFNKEFYNDYYRKYYRNLVYGSLEPTEEFFEDQLQRGRLLKSYLNEYIKKTGSFLDVGCSIGGFLIPFEEEGWDTYGVDPDTAYIEYGKAKGINVEHMDAEKMVLDKKYDVIIIMGSLEHVYDPNVVLEICRKHANEGSILVLEGRGHAQSHTRTYFNQNHHRYLTLNSIELMMIKHGWEPIITTDEPICGPTRPGGIFCIGRFKNKIPTEQEFKEIIASGKCEPIKDLLIKFDELDKKFS